MVHVKAIRPLLLFLLLLLSTAPGEAAVSFRFKPGTIDAGALKTRMESSISALLTEINRAGTSGQPLNLSSLNMESGAKSRLNALWDDARFVCDKTSYISNCLNDIQGYQVRAIAITIKPVDASYQQSLNRELTISLNKKGVITGVRLATELNEDVNTILNNAGGGAVTDARQRLEILKWVEDFRCYYNERDINALSQIYSDDALIITGSVVRQRQVDDNGIRYNQKVHYKVQDKRTYINNLKRVFQINARINIKFDHISVVMHPAKDNIYGVTLHQTWQSSRYSDEGWLFLLWDFNKPEEPQIHVRTWQSDFDVDQDGVFEINDFFIP